MKKERKSILNDLDFRRLNFNLNLSNSEFNESIKEKLI